VAGAADAPRQAAGVERYVRYPDPFPARPPRCWRASPCTRVRPATSGWPGLEQLRAATPLRPPLAVQRLSRDETGRLV